MICYWNLFIFFLKKKVDGMPNAAQPEVTAILSRGCLIINSKFLLFLVDGGSIIEYFKAHQDFCLTFSLYCIASTMWGAAVGPSLNYVMWFMSPMWEMGIGPLNQNWLVNSWTNSDTVSYRTTTLGHDKVGIHVTFKKTTKGSNKYSVHRCTPTWCIQLLNI